LVKIGSPVIILASSNSSLSNLHELETPQKKEELGESSNYSMISKTVADPIIYWILSPNNPKYDYDIIVPFCRLSLTRDYFDPATVREWNSLNLSVRNLDTLSKLKKAIRSSIAMPIPRHYSYGPRKLIIILTQLVYRMEQ
jgi:TFIIF-interacting CTD phosphatase-like protein